MEPKTENAIGTWTPIYEDKGNRFIVAHKNFFAQTEDDARVIPLSTPVVEAVLNGLSWTREVIEVKDMNIPHTRGRLGFYDVAIISGPMFDEATTQVED